MALLQSMQIVLTVYQVHDNLRQSTFTFQLTLTDSKTGNAVWASEKEITKQGARASVGF